jgi:hypothetical protein
MRRFRENRGAGDRGIARNRRARPLTAKFPNHAAGAAATQKL